MSDRVVRVLQSVLPASYLLHPGVEAHEVSEMLMRLKYFFFVLSEGLDPLGPMPLW